MKNNYFLLLLCLVLSTLVNVSCIDERDFDFDRMGQTTLNPTFNLKNVVRATVNLEDFIGGFTDSITSGLVGLEYNKDQGIFIFESDTLVKPNIPSIKDIQGISIRDRIELPAFEGTITGDIYYPALDELPEQNAVLVDLGEDQDIDSAFFKKGEIQIAVSCDINHESYILLSCPSLINRQNGTVFNERINIASKGQSGVKVTNAVIDLTKYKLILDENSQIVFENRTFLKVNGKIEEAYNISVDIQFTKMDIDVIYGKLGGGLDFDFEGSQTFDFFDNSEFSSIFKEGTLNFESMIFDLTATTNVGIPAIADIKEAKSYNLNGTVKNLLEPQKIEFNYPKLLSDKEASTTKRLFINTEAIEIFPNRIDYNAGITLNPNKISGFITSDAMFRIKTKFSFPFKAKINELSYDVDMGTLDYASIEEYINSLTLILEVSNGFPASIAAQLYVIDPLGNEYAIFTNELNIAGADVALGEYSNSKTSVSKVEITKNKFHLLSSDNKAILRLKIKTSGDDFVKLDKYGNIKVNAGFDIKTSISI